jgi:hypothetical protein
MEQPKSNRWSKKRKGAESPSKRLFKKLPLSMYRLFNTPKKIQRPKSKTIPYVGLMK